MRDTGFVIRVARFGVAVGLALQPAHAGDRKPAAVRHAEISNHNSVVVAHARSAGNNFGGSRVRQDYSVAGSVKAQGRSEFFFLPVSPLESKVSSSANKTSTSSDEQKEKGPIPPRERKNVTFFRLDPKLGDISVQPVMGGVNGAQLSVGY